MMEKKAQMLPSGWSNTTIETVADITPTFERSGIKDDLQVSFVPMAAVGAGDGTIDVSLGRPFREVKKGYTPFREGDVIFAKITPCMENGKIAVVPKIINDYGFGSTEFHVLRPTICITAQYLYRYISRSIFRGEAEHNMTGAVGQRRVPATFLEQHEFPLPPLPEQHRIVAKIEELFSELDKGVENLKTAREQLKVYRQAVLKYAFEGKLTEQWRKEHADEIEPAGVLLKKVKTEREQRYQQQLAEWQQAAKTGKRISKPAKPKELPPLTEGELAELPKLPEGWGWCKVAEISDAFGGFAFKSEDFLASGKYQVIKIANVRMGYLSLQSSPAYISDTTPEMLLRYGLKKGDCVITLTGTRKKRDYGFVAMVKEDNKLLLNQRVGAIRFAKPIVPDYFQYALRGQHFQNNFFRHETGNVGQGNVGMQAITEEPIALPPSLEQSQIVQQIESRLSVVDQLEQTIDNSLQKAEALRQSILKKAFEGKLVPQDPTDEPAGVLLERIKAEKAKHSMNTVRKKKTGR